MTPSRLALVDAASGLTPLNRHFASVLAALDPAAAPEVALAAALVSRRVEEGHVCLELSAEAGRPLTPLGAPGDASSTCPSLDAWTAALRASKLVGSPGEYAPLILDGAGRLYLQRYWRYERAVADFALARAAEPLREVDRPTLASGLARYFPGGPTDWQRAAAVAAVHRSFLVVSGGPGTGKTATVVKILALLLEQPGGARLRVALAAPTGKAAARLKDTLREARATLPASPDVLDRIPTDVSTVHRLLGPMRGSSRFRHGPAAPLAADVVVVDEASMVDLPLMAKLASAVAPHARLLLLGDRNQLASVEAGAVLGDLCGGDDRPLFSAGLARSLKELTGDELEVAPVPASAGLLDSVVLLPKSYRFGSESGIGRLSKAVREGAEGALGTLRGGSFPDVAWVDVDGPGGDARALGERIVREGQAFFRARTPEDAFETFGRFRVLCALRQGPFGAAAVNEIAQRALAGAGLIRPPRTGTPWYRGRPVMIGVNDYALGLFNGDVGIAMPDPEHGGDLRVFFPAERGGLRSFPPSRLPQHETVFAMTVHKSQGSEFDSVLLLLGDRSLPLLTRELVYTGLTRAKRSAEVWATAEVFEGAVRRRIERRSGLADALRGGLSTAPRPASD